MWAGDHENRRGPYERTLGVTVEPPEHQRHDARREGDIEQDGSRSIGECLGARPGGLRRGDHAHDPRERGLLPDRVDPDVESTPGHDGACDHSIALGLRHGLGLTGDDRLVDVGRAVDDRAVDGDSGPGPHEDDVTHPELRESDGLCVLTVDPFGGVREQRRECCQGPLRLGDRAHLQPVAEQHDRDEGRELPPDLDVEETQRPGPARHEGDGDGEGDEGHHPGLAVGQLATASAQEDEPAVQEDHRPEDRRDEGRAREHGRGVAQPLLRIAAPDHDRDRERQAEPEAVAEHRDGMPGVAIVAGALP